MKTADEELVTLLKYCGIGREHALETLYTKLSPFLNSYIMGFVRCEALSNEVLQDSFMQIWQHAASYNIQRGKPLTWICCIVRNRAIDKLRAERKHLRFNHATKDTIAADEVAVDKQPEIEFSHNQSISIINNDMAKLPRNEQLCIKLAYFHDYSRNDLANALDTNVNTVKSWLRRGLIHLQGYEKNRASA